jgi:hypothetical protein
LAPKRCDGILSDAIAAGWKMHQGHGCESADFSLKNPRPFLVRLLPFPEILIIFCTDGERLTPYPGPATARTKTERPPFREVSTMAYTKPLFRQSDIKRAFDAARKSPVPLRSIDFFRPDGTRLSFVIGDPEPATTTTTETTNELDEWMAKKHAG